MVARLRKGRQKAVKRDRGNLTETIKRNNPIQREKFKDYDMTKKILLAAVVLACAALQSVYAQTDRRNPNAYNLTDEQYMALADSIHRVAVSLDTHVDTPTYVLDPDGDFTVAKGQVTFELMKKGGLDGACFAVYLDQGPWKEKDRLDSAYNYCRDLLIRWNEYVDRHSDIIGIAYTPEDCIRLKKEGKLISILCIENGYPIRSVEDVDEFYRLGVRYVTLSHNSANQICDGSRRPNTAVWHGVSPFGYKVVERMQQLGIMVDLSHVSSEAMRDLFKVTKAPLVNTHTGCQALKPGFNRNVSDEEIIATAATGGVVQISSGKFFLTNDLPYFKVGVKLMANHIDHVKNLVGAEYVGFGSDFDGGGGVVGYDNEGQLKNVTVELLKRGWTAKEVEGFLGGNFLRAWKACEDYARNFQK